MCQAIAVAGSHVYDWVSAHPNSFPPIVINITDGMVTDSPYEGVGLEEWAARLTGIQTNDGPAMLFNVFLSPSGENGSLFPASDRGLRSQAPPCSASAASCRRPCAPMRRRRGCTWNQERGDSVSMPIIRCWPSSSRSAPGSRSGTDPERCGRCTSRRRCSANPSPGTHRTNGRTAPWPAPPVPSAGLGQVPSRVRYVVADGATVGYASRQWVNQLVTCFAPVDNPARGPRLDRASMRRWFAQMQDLWAAHPPATLDVIDELKFKGVGSFATFLGFELSGLAGPEPRWHAVALGDTVLFHVRAGRLQASFPPLGPDDFDADPDGVHSMPSSLDRMSDRLLIGSGDLAPGDFLFAATDAMAHWIIRAVLRDAAKTWTTLSEMVHPAIFRRFVRDQRRADRPERLKDDDVTLMRLRMLDNQPSYLLVCL